MMDCNDGAVMHDVPPLPEGGGVDSLGPPPPDCSWLLDEAINEEALANFFCSKNDMRIRMSFVKRIESWATPGPSEHSMGRA